MKDKIDAEEKQLTLDTLEIALSFEEYRNDPDKRYIKFLKKEIKKLKRSL